MRLEYYRLQKISEGSISLKDGKASRSTGPSEVGSGLVREQPVPLSQLIDVVNERFGTDFNQADQLFFDQIVEAAMSDDGLRQAAAVNPGDKFELVFKNLLETLFVERMDQNEEIFVRFMNDTSFQKVVTTWMSDEAYRRLRKESELQGKQPTGPASALSNHARRIGTFAAYPSSRSKWQRVPSAIRNKSMKAISSGQRSTRIIAFGKACSSHRWSGSRWSQ